jgi:phosphinothricin acetyltransferase
MGSIPHIVLMNGRPIGNVGPEGDGMTMIRMATTDDAAALAEIYKPVVERTPISFEMVPPDAAEMARRLTAGQSHAPWLVAVDGGHVAGFAYASKHRDRPAYQWSVDASVYVAESRRREGVGRALYTSLFAILAQQRFYAVHAGITMCNDDSIAMHEAVGFRRVAVFPSVGFKLGRWHDVGWWQLTLGERAPDPPPPLPVEAVLATPAGRAALDAGLAVFRARGGSRP